jgi:hypothetical protein
MCYRPLRPALVILLAVAAPAGAEPLRLLFFGNSFTQGGSTCNVASTVEWIATAAGHETPYVVHDLSGGTDLDYHIEQVDTFPANNVDRISSGLHWDYVVMQEYSTNPTHIGNPADFRSDAVALSGRIRAHSPDVEAVLFETWARAPGHYFYPSSFPDPAAMQAELRSNYNLAAGDILSSGGSARVAPVGDAWESTGWNNLHGGDLYHGNERGYTLASMVIYRSVYGCDVSDIPYSAVSLWASSRGLDAGEWAELASAADGDYQGPPADALAVGRRVRADLGGSMATAGAWNNLGVEDYAQSAQYNLIDDLGTTTSVDLAVSGAFDAVDETGLDDSSVFPATVQRDSFRVGSSLGHEQALNRSAQLTFSGLEPGVEYELELFASASGDDESRGYLARYAVGNAFVDLDASNNAAEVAVLAGLISDANGKLQLDVGVSPLGDARWAFLGGLSLRAVDGPLPGDATGDRQVTDADYTAWADHYAMAGATRAMGDFNDSGIVTEADYTIWADNYGLGTTAGVPEPCIALMLLPGLLALRRR